MKPEVSIIVPVVRRPDVTRRCVDHIRRNTPPIYELIVVADQSDGETLKYLVELHGEGVRILLNPELVGFSTAVNQGIQVSRAPYIAIVTNDVYVRPRWLQPLKKALDRFGLAWVSAQIVQPDGVFRPFNISCCLIRRDALEKVGLLDEGFVRGKGFEDDDLAWRFIKAGYRLAGVPSSVADHPESEVTFKSLHGEERIKELGEINARRFYEKWGFVGTQWGSFPCVNVPYDRYDWLRDKVRELGGGLIVDVGSAGNITFQGFPNVVCLDVDLYAVEDFVRGDAHHLPFRGGVFNAATLGDTLEHLEDPVKALGEARRVAEHVLLTVPDDKPDDALEPLMSEVYWEMDVEGKGDKHREAVERWVRDNQPVEVLDDERYRHLFHRRFYSEVILGETLRQAGLKYRLERIEYENYRGWGVSAW